MDNYEDLINFGNFHMDDIMDLQNYISEFEKIVFIQKIIIDDVKSLQN